MSEIKLKPWVKKAFDTAFPTSEHGIRQRVEGLYTKIDWMHEEIKLIQKSCDHINHTYENWGNTGNYDPSQDCYGTIVRCLDCRARINMDQIEYYQWAEGKNGCEVKGGTE